MEVRGGGNNGVGTQSLAEAAGPVRPAQGFESSCSLAGASIPRLRLSLEQALLMASNLPGQVVQGYLHKSSAGSWRKRWVRLECEDARLLCFKGSCARQPPRAVLDIAQGQVHADDEGGAQMSVLAGDGTSLLLAAASPEDAASWVNALRRSIGAYTRSPRESALKLKRSRGCEDSDVNKPSKRRADSSGPHSPCAASSDGSLPVLLVLEVTGGPLAGERFEIGPEGVDIIRKPTGIAAAHMKALKQLQLPDPDVSRAHAQIRCAGTSTDGVSAARDSFSRGAVYSIRDLGSLNGTIINGKRVSAEKQVSEWVELNGGDELVLGKTALKVFFSVKLPEEKESEDRRRRRAERKARREERRSLLLARAGVGAGAGAAEGAVAHRERVRASTDVFLASVLGLGEGAGAGAGAGGGGMPKLAPNKVALTNIVAGVLDHNERVQDTVDAKKHVQHEKMPLLPPPPTPMDQMKSQGLPTKFR